MLEPTKELLKMVVADDEFFKLNAQMNKKALDYLIEEGFTKEEALQILSSQGPGIST